MKLLIAIVNGRDARRLREALVDRELRFTEFGTTSGFLRERNVSLMIGLPDDQVESVLGLIREQCRARRQVVNLAHVDTRPYPHPVGDAMEVTVGGAQVFVVSVERLVQI